jgi:hypothetical protein
MHRTVRFVSGRLALLALAIGSDQTVGGAARPRAIELSLLGVYRSGLFDGGAVEIVAYDPASRRAYLTFAERPKLDVVDLSDPMNPIVAATIDLTPWGADAHATSVSVRTDHGGSASGELQREQCEQHPRRPQRRQGA